MTTIGLRIKALRAERKVSQEWVASRVGVKYQTIQDLENGSSRGTKHVVAIARAFEVEPHWLETGLGPKEILNPQPMRTLSTPEKRAAVPELYATNDGPKELLKVLGMAEGGEDGWSPFQGDVVQYIERPDNLRGVVGAYAVFVRGSSMSPRYEQGEIVHIHPSKPVQPGAYVLVQRKPKDRGDQPLAILKRLVRRTATKVVLAQLNPEKQFEVPAVEIVDIHRVVGSSEG